MAATRIYKEGRSDRLNNRLAGAFHASGQGTLGASLYINTGYHVVAPANIATDSNKAFVRDHIDGTQIKPKKSIAADILNQNNAAGWVGAPSIPFPKDHMCHHVTSPDGNMLVQIVKKRGKGDALTTTERTSVQTEAEKAFDDVVKLRHLLGRRAIDHVFGPFETIDPNVIILYGDMTGYRMLAAQSGLKKADGLMTRFIEGAVVDLCRHHGSDVFRPSRGDDLWLSLYAMDLGVDLNRDALPLASSLVREYDVLRAGDSEYNAHPFRVAVTAGYVKEHFSQHVQHTGEPLITATMLNSQADRTRSCVVIDPDLLLQIDPQRHPVTQKAGLSYLKL